MLRGKNFFVFPENQLTRIRRNSKQEAIMAMDEGPIQRTRDDQTFRLQDLLPSDLVDSTRHTDHELFVPSWAFLPDGWSWAFLRGLRKLDLAAAHVWEIGVGTGLNQILIGDWHSLGRAYYSDYNPDCTRLASVNIPQDGPDVYVPLHGRWDLVHNGHDAPPNVNVIVACIPQVPANDRSPYDGDNLAHYYNTRWYPESTRHVQGLGLNEALLLRAHSVLQPGDRVVLNLGGRPGISELRAMFTECGYDARVVHEEMVEQHPGTSLESLVILEDQGHPPFELFKDEGGECPISVKEAEERRRLKCPVFHKIYVIEGTMRSNFELPASVFTASGPKTELSYFGQQFRDRFHKLLSAASEDNRAAELALRIFDACNGYEMTSQQRTYFRRLTMRAIGGSMTNTDRVSLLRGKLN